MILSSVCYLSMLLALYWQGQLCNLHKPTPVVELELGKIKGSVLKNDKGEDFLAFRGIPYGKPPLGQFRFKNPVEVEPWEGILDGTEYGNDCLQTNVFTDVHTGDEDCLYLNVFTPNLPSKTAESMAVMVYIHGGYLLVGSGAKEGPVRLMDKNVVMVSMNYRLGAFGFLCTGDEESPGNFALFDQLAALNWVKRHIRAFNGDPSRVTLFGISAGSASVSLHQLSPLSSGLFYAAILQSGTAFSDRFIEYKPLLQAQRLAKELNCPIDNTKSIVQCIRETPGKEILKATALIRKGDQINGTFPFRPVIDKTFRENAFLPGAPKQLFKEGKFNEVPIISGVAKLEGLFYYLDFAKAVKTATSAEEAFTVEDYEAILPLFAQEMFRDDDGAEFTKEMTEAYIPNHKNASLDSIIEGVFLAIGDTAVTSYHDVVNEIIASHGVPVYAYKFTHYVGQNSKWINLPGFQLIPEGFRFAAHSDEAAFLFAHNGTMFANADDAKMSNILTTLWTTFAKSRVPSLSSGHDCEDITVWKPLFNKSDYSHLGLNTDPFVVEGWLSSREIFIKKLKEIISKT